jgi:hypothetical protein
MDYLRCHDGAQLPTLGTFRRNGLQDRDGLNLAFSQLGTNHVTAVPGTGNLESIV